MAFGPHIWGTGEATDPNLPLPQWNIAAAPRLIGAEKRMKKPAKTAAELEAIIKVEMEQISDLPTELAISVRPDGDTWKAVVMQKGGASESDRFEMIMLICDRLRSEFDLAG